MINFSFSAVVLSFLCLFGISEAIYFTMKLKVEYTRKLVHIFAGILALQFPKYFGIEQVIILCASFFIILRWSKNNNQLNGVNAIQRKSYGSELFPVAVLICFMVYKLCDESLYFYLPIAILTFADSMAALAGQKIDGNKWTIGDKNKSLAGSLVFLIVSILVIVIIGKIWVLAIEPFSILGLALIIMIVELFSKKGSDNLTIPLFAMLGLKLFIL